MCPSVVGVLCAVFTPIALFSMFKRFSGSRLASPRHGVAGGRNRKRALSHSPISDYLDIQSLTRSSDGSLQMTSLLGHHASRGSSVGSGSYGHLSAGRAALMAVVVAEAADGVGIIVVISYFFSY